MGILREGGTVWEMATTNLYNDVLLDSKEYHLDGNDYRYRSFVFEFTKIRNIFNLMRDCFF